MTLLPRRCLPGSFFLRKARWRATVLRVNTFTLSQRGLALIKESEADSRPNLEAYWDRTGQVWTIGYGHTGHDVKEGLIWSEQQCEQALLNDASFACHAVNMLVTYPLNQNQFDALVDFVFNEGATKFKGSTLLRLLNEGNVIEAALEFPLWKYSGGVVLPGLVDRRSKEQALFNSPLQ